MDLHLLASTTSFEFYCPLHYDVCIIFLLFLSSGVISQTWPSSDIGHLLSGTATPLILFSENRLPRQAESDNLFSTGVSTGLSMQVRILGLFSQDMLVYDEERAANQFGVNTNQYFRTFQMDRVSGEHSYTAACL